MDYNRKHNLFVFACISLIPCFALSIVIIPIGLMAMDKEINSEVLLQHSVNTFVDIVDKNRVHTSEALMGDALRRQIDLGRLKLKLQQDIDITKQFKELLKNWRSIQPYTNQLEAFLSDTHEGLYVDYYQNMLRELNAMDITTSLDESPEEKPYLVFASAGNTAIFKYKENYFNINLGGLLRVSEEDYRLVTVDDNGVLLKTAQGKQLRLNMHADTP